MAQGVEGMAEAAERASGKNGRVAGEEGEGGVRLVGEGGDGGVGCSGVGSVCAQDGLGNSDPQRVVGLAGLEETVDKPSAPDGVPCCDVLTPGEEAKAPFLGAAVEKLGEDGVEVRKGVAVVL